MNQDLAMDLLIINRDEVVELLPMEECVTLMEETLAALTRGEALVPLRSAMWLPDRSGLLGMMPGYLAGEQVMGIKVVSVMPGNHGTELDAHQGAVLIFESNRGRTLALVDASEITAIRTAAVSGAATRALARKDAGDLAILGSGTQASTHLQAMRCVRPIRRVRVWSRSKERLQRFCDREAARHGLELEPAATAREAVTGADLICTTTAAREPVLEGSWITRGAHINAVGSSVRTARELDSEVLHRSTLFVDSRESAMAEAGDLLMAEEKGAGGDVGRERVGGGPQAAEWIRGELGEVLEGKVVGRASDSDITLFESLGLGIEDVAAAHFVYEKARTRNLGLSVALGGEQSRDN